MLLDLGHLVFLHVGYFENTERFSRFRGSNWQFVNNRSYSEEAFVKESILVRSI
jgi:hypothetical protein